MRIFHPLRDRRIALLFTGQVLSCIGDEVYNVAIVWFAVSLIGERAGYLSALQAGAVLAFSLLGGIWADRYDQRKTLIWADVFRGCAVLIPVLLYPFLSVSLAILIPVAIVEASFTGLFNPALRALVPEIVEERALLNATNGLVEATVRLGRVIGPGFVALIGRWVPLIHFFTIDAVSFFFSAFSFGRMGPVTQPHPDAPPGGGWSRVREGVLAGGRAACEYPPVRFALLTGILSTPTWHLVMPLSMALLVHSRMPESYSALGLFIASYGAGNVVGNLWAGSVELKRPELFLSWGRFIAGVGFLAMSIAPTLPWLMLTASFAASGGPITDLGMLALVQDRYRGVEAARVFRFHLAYFYSMILVAFAVSPVLFRAFGVARVIGGCGAAIALAGVLGLLWFPVRSIRSFALE